MAARLPAAEAEGGRVMSGFETALAGAVTSVIVNPIVGKLVEAAGETVSEEFRRRFGAN